MTETEIIELAASMPGVVAMTAGPDSGAPEAAWGDTFFYYDPDDRAENRRMPFATLVVTDYAGFDTASDLDRPGVFRLNVSVGRQAFEELIGSSPGAQREGIDYTVLDQLLPHPVYATQSWVSILNPGEQARALLTRAYDRARAA